MEAVPSEKNPMSLFVHPYKLNKNAAASFVGPNLDKYWKRWISMAARASKTSWHWPSFFLGPIWMGYRRMHSEAFASIAILAVATLLVAFAARDAEEGASAAIPAYIVANLVCMILFGVFGNFLYLRKTAIAVRTAQETDPANSSSLLAARGGRSALPAVAWAVPALALGSVFESAFVPEVQALTAEQQNSAYFVAERFRNPHLMKSVFEHEEGDASVPNEARLINAFYVKYAIDRVKEACGWEPTGFAAVAKGTLDVGEGVLITAHTISSVTELLDGKASAAVIGWLQGINGIDMVKQYARGDIDRFIKDSASCASPQARQMTDGFNWYLTYVAPKILL